MKNFLFIYLLFICFGLKSQNYIKTEISIISPNRDTLWLIDNDMGNLIKQSWEIYPPRSNEKIPVILMIEKFPKNKKNKKNKKKIYK